MPCITIHHIVNVEIVVQTKIIVKGYNQIVIHVFTVCINIGILQFITIVIKWFCTM